MIVQLLFVAAIGAVFLFTLVQRKRMMTEIDNLKSNNLKIADQVTEIDGLKNSMVALKAINTGWMHFMDGFASKLKAIEAAVIARNPGDNDDQDILDQLAAARAELAERTARLNMVQGELVTRTADLTEALGLLDSANTELGEIKAGVIEVSQALADEGRRVGSNVAVAESMIEGMIKTGDPYNGLDKPDTDS